MSKQSNSAAIRRGFKWLKGYKESVCLDGITRIAKAGMDYLLEAHEEHEHGMMHTMERNTIAYAIGHNGSVIESGYHDGGDGDRSGRAREMAERHISGTRGYVAVILSDMESWYRLDYEMDFFYYTVDHIKAHFDEFFKKVS